MEALRMRIMNDLERSYNDNKAFNKREIEEYVISFIKDIIKNCTNPQVKVESFRIAKNNLELWYYYNAFLRTALLVTNNYNEQSMREGMKEITENMMFHYDKMVSEAIAEKMEADSQGAREEMMKNRYILISLIKGEIASLLNTSALVMATMVYGYYDTEDFNKAAQVIQNAFTEFLLETENESELKYYIMNY